MHRMILRKLLHMLGESHTYIWRLRFRKGNYGLFCLIISGFILTEIPQNDCIFHCRSVYYCLQNKEQHIPCYDSDKHIDKFNVLFLYLLTHGRSQDSIVSTVTILQDGQASSHGLITGTARDFFLLKHRSPTPITCARLCCVAWGRICKLCI